MIQMNDKRKTILILDKVSWFRDVHAHCFSVGTTLSVELTYDSEKDAESDRNKLVNYLFRLREVNK